MTLIRPVHIGLSVDALSRDDIVAVAQCAEQLGYRGLWLTESFGRDVFGVLTQVAIQTRTLELGTGIVNVYGRSVATVAQCAATLTELLPGRRLNLGIGTSGRGLVEEFHGIPFDRPVARLRDYLAVLRGAFAGEGVRHDGEVVRLPGFPLGVTPGCPVRVFVAALTPASRRVARDADGWLPIWLPDSAIDTSVSDTIAAYYYTAVDPDTAAAVDIVRRSLAWYIAANGTAYANQFARMGFPGEVDEIVQLWHRGDRTGARAAVLESMVAHTAMAGAPEAVAKRLARVQRAGVTEPILRFPDELPAIGVQGMLRALAEAAIDEKVV